MGVSTNSVYSGFRACLGPRPRAFHCWYMEPAARPTGGSYRMPLSRWYQKEGRHRSPRSLGVPQVRPEDNYQILRMSRNKPGISGIQVYQEYDLYWNISRYNQAIRSSFLLSW